MRKTHRATIDLFVSADFDIPIDVYARDVEHFWLQGKVGKVFVEPIGKGMGLIDVLRGKGIVVEACCPLGGSR